MNYVQGEMRRNKLDQRVESSGVQSAFANGGSTSLGRRSEARYAAMLGRAATRSWCAFSNACELYASVE